MRRRMLGVVLPIGFVLAAALTVGLRADGRAAEADAEMRLARELVGTWVLVGKPGAVGEPPEKGGRLKHFTGGHWCITEADPETGVVIFHHGGRYSLDGDRMTSSVEYANESTRDRIGGTSAFRVVVEGDTYTQFGLDNEFTEVWKRVE